MFTHTTSTQLAGATAVALTLAGPLLAAGLDNAGMVWLAPLDHYCERVTVGPWNEPLNAGSNLAFLLAAAIILIRQQRAGWSDRTLVLLAMLAGTLGAGSILFHTFANGWSLLADMLPIAVFIYAFFFVALRRFLNLAAVSAGLATVGLYLASPALETLFRPLLGASAAYAPGLLATLGVAVAAPVLSRGPAPRLLVAAGFAFSMAGLSHARSAALRHVSLRHPLSVAHVQWRRDWSGAACGRGRTRGNVWLTRRAPVCPLPWRYGLNERKCPRGRAGRSDPPSFSSSNFVKRSLAGFGAALAGLGADAAMLVFSPMPLALLPAFLTGLRARLNRSPENFDI